jgi:peptidoglycan/xylan/chitin deacetylase (PgdA/CDA1 family)
MSAKTWLQRCIKESLLFSGRLRAPVQTGCTFLIYHSVTGRLPIELDLAPALLERQLAYLAQSGRVIAYEEALQRLRQGIGVAGQVVLTFDDGYLDFYTTVYPLLQRWQLPATLFVTTGFVEERVAYPMVSYPHLAVEPVTWAMLAEMAASGLVTIGAHTHTHPDLTMVSAEQMEEELAKPIARLQARIGLTPKHFCYPRARWHPDREVMVARYYETAVVGGGEEATSVAFQPYRIPRLPIRRSDGWRYFQAKVEGQMANEEAFYGYWHQSLRRSL